MIGDKNSFFFDRFKFIAGTKSLENQIKKGLSEQEIKASWKPKIDAFKKTRVKYLLYAD